MIADNNSQSTTIPDAESQKMALPASLPDDPEILKALLIQLQSRIATQEQQIQDLHAQNAQQIQAGEQQIQALHTRNSQQIQAMQAEHERRMQALYEQIRLARRRMFGASSESHSAQAWLFDEAEVLAAGTDEASDTAILPVTQPKPSAPETRKPRGKRKPLPADLPRVDVVHELPTTERTCPCGCVMVEIGEDISEQLDIVPMQIQVLRHIRKRYGCPCGEHAPQSAPVPPQVLPKSNASNDLLAMLLTAKYVDGLPLARFEYVLGRSGAVVPRQTLARWVIGTSQALQPVFNLLRDTLLESRVIHMDETPVQVLKEPGRPAQSQSYMWVQRSGPPDKPVVLFDYDPSRSGQVPKRLLAGWSGYLMTDGYDGYNAVVREQHIIHLGCWVHARRYLVDATKAMPSGKGGRAEQAIRLIAKLYAVEKVYRDKTDEERFAARQAHSLPTLVALREWLDTTLPLVPPRTKLGEALNYLAGHWERLVRYCERGDLPIDNNPAENSIRPFVVGRKAWLHADTPAGAHASALIYSLIETAKANGQEPYIWLRRTLERLPTAKTVEDYEALLPWNVHAQDLAIESSC
jgi:transposase